MTKAKAKKKAARKPRAKRSVMGRPTKRTDETDALILKALGVGCSMSNASKLAGVDPDTLAAWRKADDTFSVACEKAAANASFRLAAKLFNKAEDGDTTSLIFWLKCRAPEFREPKEAPPDEGTSEPDPRFE